MTFCLSAIDPAASRSVTYLQNLAGNPKNKPFKAALEKAACLLLDRAEDCQEFRRRIITLELETLKMARDFIAAVDVVLAHDAKATSDVTALTVERDKLAADLAAAQANALTPETKVAQEKIVAASEVISPSV